MLPDLMLAAAASLSARDRGRLALGVAALLAPLLNLDMTEVGQRRSSELRELLAVIQSAPDDHYALQQAADTLGSSEELAADEEPDGPAAFRVDFAAALLYAVRALLGSDDDFKTVWTRTTDSIAFLVDYAKRGDG